MASCGHSATHVPHPWQLAEITWAGLCSSILMAPYGHLVAHMPHLPVTFRHLLASTTEIIGSIFHFGFEMTVAAREAAPLPCETLYGMSFKPWQAPAKNMPSVGASKGFSFGWLSMKKPSAPRVRLRMRASSSEPFLGMEAVAKTTISASTSMGTPRFASSECRIRLCVFGSSSMRLTRPRMKFTPPSLARS